MVCSHMLYISVCYKTLFTPTITITDRVDNYQYFKHIPDLHLVFSGDWSKSGDYSGE